MMTSFKKQEEILSELGVEHKPKNFNKKGEVSPNPL
jgi:hypothetical protein